MARATSQPAGGVAAPSRGRYVGTGNGPAFQPIDIGHPDYVAVIEPDTAFWALVRARSWPSVALGGDLVKAYRKKAGAVRRGDAHAAVRPEAVGRLLQPDRALQPELHLLLHPRDDAPQGTAHVARAAAGSPGDPQAVLPHDGAQGLAAADHLPRRRAAAEPRGRLRRHRAVSPTISASASRPTPRCWTTRPSRSSATTT